MSTLREKIIADWLVQLADIKPEHRILEPSAGQGAIIKAIYRNCPDRKKVVNWCELMPLNQTFLQKIPQQGPNKYDSYIADDYLKKTGLGDYDRIIANPPFAKNQDIDHIRKMYTDLAPGGRLVSIASKHWETSSNRKETEFIQWITEVNASVRGIKPGAFKESGTMIGMNVIIIDKPAGTGEPACSPKSCKGVSDPPIFGEDKPTPVRHKIADGNATATHLLIKDGIINHITKIITKATKNPTTIGGDLVSLDQFLKVCQATKPKQIAEKTAEFIRMSDTEQTGVNADGCIEFGFPAKATYKVPDAIALPGILLSIKQHWGDGKSHDPSAGGNPDYLGRDFRNKMQQNIMDKRRFAQSKPSDPKMIKKRDKYIDWLKMCTDTNNLEYQCRNFILNPKTLEGVHIPAPEQKVIFSMGEWATDEKERLIAKGWAYRTGEPVCSPKPEPAPVRPIAPSPVPKPEPRTGEPACSPLTIIDYSPKAIALFGSTKALKQQLLDLHGAFCRHLKVNGQPTPGWVFSKKRESAVRQLIAS